MLCPSRKEDSLNFVGLLELGCALAINVSPLNLRGDVSNIHQVHQADSHQAAISSQAGSAQPVLASKIHQVNHCEHQCTRGQGTEMTEAISLDMSSSNARDINLTHLGFAKMEKLRFLKFYASNVFPNHGNKVHALEGLEFVFTDLMYLHWYGFQLKSLQPNFQLENLVILEMPNSNVEELWSGFQQLVNLKRINLMGSHQLIRCPDLLGTPNLESLMLRECTKSSKQHLTSNSHQIGTSRLVFCCHKISSGHYCFSNLKHME
ncbi:hypothetical protein QYF36_007595 [Acer negundo]|nr:hypothetical protein QYF36_007595 [Acer negundo]